MSEARTVAIKSFAHVKAEAAQRYRAAFMAFNGFEYEGDDRELFAIIRKVAAQRLDLATATEAILHDMVP